MNKIWLFLISVILSNLFLIPAQASNERKIFIMLNVDNTIVDRVDRCDIKQINVLRKMGINTQKLEFFASKDTSPKFVDMYEKLSKGDRIIGESDYMSKIKVKKNKEGYFHITECLAIRPSAKILLERLSDLKLPMVVLLTSRNDDERSKNLQAKLDLYIDGKNFTESTKFIPRDWFRVKIKTVSAREISAKSAVELRKRYSVITKDDFVILLDHIESSRFIKNDSRRDLNIVVSKFTVGDYYDDEKEKKEIDSIINQIIDFIELCNE